MANRALDGVETLRRVGKVKKKVFKAKPDPIIVEDDFEDTAERPVRVPRTTPAARMNALERVAGNDTLLQKDVLGKQEHTEARREIVLAWMLNGHLHDGQLMTPTELAISLEMPLKTIEMDISTLKEKMADFHTTEDIKDVPALAHMLMEMKFQDRGRALALYNIIMGDIRQSDAVSAVMTKVVSPNSKTGALTGRDRAAMYSAALSALDLSNKATNGMDSLFKMTGGAQRLQTIIKAKNVQINAGNGFTLAQLQEFVTTEMGGVLPSTRKLKGALPMPKILDLTPEDKKLMEMGNQK